MGGSEGFVAGVELVDGGGFEGGAHGEYGACKFGDVDGVGDEAGLEADAAVGAELATALAGLFFLAGVGIEDKGGHVGVGAHPAALIVGVEVGYGLAGLLLVEDVKLVIDGVALHGEVAAVVGVYGVADATQIGEVSRGALYRGEAAAGDGLGVAGGAVGGADPQVVVADVAGLSEVEVDVVRGVEDGVAIGGKFVLDGQPGHVVEAVTDLGGHVATEAHGVGVVIFQHHALAVDVAGPELLAVVVGGAVEEVLLLVALELILTVADGEAAALYAVGATAHNTAGAAEGLDALAGLTAEDHVAELTVAVKYHHGVDDGAVLDYLYILALLVGKGEPAHLAPVLKLAVDVRCDHNLSSFPH